MSSVAKIAGESLAHARSSAAMPPAIFASIASDRQSSSTVRRTRTAGAARGDLNVRTHQVGGEPRRRLK